MLRLMQTIRPVALGAAVVLALGVASAAPALAAPKPRLPITITGQPSNPSDSSAAGFTWSTVAGATYTCQLDNAAATSCTSPKSYSGLADGTHRFIVQGKKNGTYRPGSATVQWTVDSVPPGAPTIAPVATPTATTSASISFTNSDATTVSHLCALDGACRGHLHQSVVRPGSPGRGVPHRHRAVAGPLREPSAGRRR